MSTNQDLPDFDAFDFPGQLDRVIGEAEAVQQRLQAIMSGLGSPLLSSYIRKGMQEHARMFKGISNSYQNALAQVTRVRTCPKKYRWSE